MRNPLPFMAMQAFAIAACLLCILCGVSTSAVILALVLPCPLALVALIRSPWDPVFKTVLIVAELLLLAAFVGYILLLLAISLSGQPPYVPYG